MLIRIDVGGGAVADATPQNISNISLRWMVHEVMKARSTIQFDEIALARASIPHVVFADTPLETIPETAELDAVDALAPIHDELKLNVIWWLLEVIPFTYSWQDANGVWHREFRLAECFIILIARS